MAPLPPAEKLPLALRKNIRDEWDNKKADVEKQLSDHLGTAWTFEANPLAIYPYATEGYGKESLGSCLYSYFSDATSRISYFKDSFGDEGVKELNSIASAHVLTIEVDETTKFSYCGVEVRDGKLVIVVKPGNLGVNTYNALEAAVLESALNNAPAPADADSAGLSYTARTGVRQSYDEKIEAVRKRIGDNLNKPDIKLTPNFEANYAALKAESAKKKTDLSSDWQTNLGQYALRYFEGFAYQLEYQQFNSDDMLQEGFNDIVDKGEISLKIIDKLETGVSYNEVVIKDGVCYIQSTPTTYGTNVDYAADKLLEKL